MEIVLEEGKEAAREHQAQDPAIKLVFQRANVDKNGPQMSLGKLNVKETAAIAAEEDALLFKCVWEQQELREGVLYGKWHKLREQILMSDDSWCPHVYGKKC